MTSKAHAFATAAYYDCEASETLEHETVHEAIAAYFDYHAEPGVPVQKQIESLCPLEVTAYQRDEVTEKWLRAEAEAAVDSFEESYSEEYYMHPDAERPFEGSRGKRAELVQKIQALFAEQVKLVPPWNCTEVARRMYGADEVEVILREAEPTWSGAAS